ncbi:Mitochondrial inner membrane magnesium transporter MRS2 [Ceratocystis fimbriata CBS 114723]|uniref:Magnesium transporter n=3 Tax=Ceratocystis TaxID=5157 RepID=A0A2C5WST4_9PEZI|nr:Mitochondrial inner membrane magnesium transporter MRS2 [Ceratocystis fimbriata CBS 114723]
MSSSLRSTTPAPSRALLRFLRAQSENRPFFSPRCRVLGNELRGIRVYSSHSSNGSYNATTSPISPPNAANPLARITPATPVTVSSILTLPVLKRTPSLGPARGFSGSGRTQASGPNCGSGEEERILSWRERIFNMRISSMNKDAETQAMEERYMFNPRRTLTAKAALEPRLRCTEVDENGEVSLTDSEFKKTELIAKYGLLPRDLRKIDSSNLPHILVRPSAILINLLHLKVLIKHDRVLLFDVYGSQTSHSQSAFMYDLQGKLKQKNPTIGAGLPYEFRALEAVLTSVTSELEADFESVREPIIHILSELEDDIDRHKLRLLLILSKKVTTFEQKAKLVRDAIEELLEADDDLSAMYLTEKTHDLFRGDDDHTEIELLLESYHKLCDEIVQEAGNLVSSIRNTEEIIRAILDANRNSLMLLDLKFSVGTLGLAMGTFMAGLYGMNLENFIEESDWGFAAVTGASILCSVAVCWYGLVKLRKIQRVKMMVDERNDLSRTQRWIREEALLDPRSREKLRMMNLQKLAAGRKKKWGWW